MRKKIEMARKQKEELNDKFEGMRECVELNKNLEVLKSREHEQLTKI